MDNLAVEALNRMKNKRKNLVKYDNKKKNVPHSKYISNLFTRTLLSIILCLLCAIFISISDKNLIFFKDHFLNNTLAFNKINSLYSKYFGNIIPEKLANNLNTIPVFETQGNYKSITEQGDSYKIELTSSIFSYLESGVVVFLGEKEEFGKTIIVQGIDGVDIWYSNLENYNCTLYDYVEKESIIGEFKDNSAVLTFIKDGKAISYENYLF